MLATGFNGLSGAPRKVVADFEILTKPASPPAITMNAAVLTESPQDIRVQGRDIEIIGLNGSLGWLENLPQAVLDAANSHEGLLVVELSTFGVKSAQLLRNCDLAPDLRSHLTPSGGG